MCAFPAKRRRILNHFSWQFYRTFVTRPLIWLIKMEGRPPHRHRLAITTVRQTVFQWIGSVTRRKKPRAREWEREISMWLRTHVFLWRINIGGLRWPQTKRTRKEQTYFSYEMRLQIKAGADHIMNDEEKKLNFLFSIVFRTRECISCTTITCVHVLLHRQRWHTSSD